VRTLSGIVIVHAVEYEKHLITVVADMWCDCVGHCSEKGNTSSNISPQIITQVFQ